MQKTTGTKVIGLTNPHNEPHWVVSVEARLDTGASRSSIDEVIVALRNELIGSRLRKGADLSKVVEASLK